MRSLRLTLLVCCVAVAASGCYASKIVTVPMRLGGAVLSAVPFVGNTAHDAVDAGAEAIDDVL